MGARTRAGRTGRLVLVIAAGSLLVTSCGSGSGENKKTASPSPSGKVELPGIKEFGLTEKQFADHVERAQALIATCMREAGFEYVAVDVQTIEAAQKRVRSDPGLTRRTYKEKYGLGATTRFDNPVRDTGLGPQNLRVIANLSKGDRVAYERTLWGENTRADFVFALDEEDFSEAGGCTRKAVAQVFTAEQLKGTYVNPKDVIVDSDPRIVKARGEWVKCMRAAGFDYTEDQDEIIEDFEERLAELVEDEDPEALTGERASQLKDLQADEVAAALADLECQIKHTDDIVRKVEFEVFGQTVSG